MQLVAQKNVRLTAKTVENAVSRASFLTPRPHHHTTTIATPRQSKSTKQIHKTNPQDKSARQIRKTNPQNKSHKTNPAGYFALLPASRYICPAIRCHHDLIGNPVRIRNNTRCCISPVCLAKRARASAKPLPETAGRCGKRDKPEDLPYSHRRRSGKH